MDVGNYRQKKQDILCPTLSFAYLTCKVSNRDITYNATEFVLLLYHIVYGVFSSAFKIYFAHRVLYENENKCLNWPPYYSPGVCRSSLVILGALTSQKYHQFHGLEPPNVQRNSLVFYM